MDFEVEIDGVKGIRRELDKLDDNVAYKALQKSVREGAKVIMDESRRILRSRGYSHDTVFGTVTRDKRVSRYFVRASVGYIKKQAQLNLLEFGAGPHVIPQTYVTKHGTRVKREIKHPGFSPRPWLRPAFMSKTEEALRKFGEQIWEEIKKHGRP